MSSSKSFVKAFNDVLEQFFQELMTMYPDNSKIKLNHTLFATLCKTNVKKPAIEFMESAIPHLEKMANRDESVMFAPNRPEIVDKLNVPVLWAGMSEATRASIWDYMFTLLRLANQFVETPVEVKQVIDYVISTQ
jgi:hypothetical protein